MTGRRRQSVPSRATKAGRALFLDIGNTLVGDPRPGIWDLLAGRWPKDVVEELRAVDAEANSPFVSHFWGERAFCELACARVRSDGIRRLSGNALLADYRRAAAATLASDQLVPLRSEPLISVLKTLRKQGVSTIGLLSNERVGNVAQYRRVLGMPTAAIDLTVISSPVGFGKPDPRIFELARSRTELAAEAIFHVGDSRIYDLDSAAAAGMTPIRFTGLAQSDDTWSPSIDRLDLLPDVVGESVRG